MIRDEQGTVADIATQVVGKLSGSYSRGRIAITQKSFAVILHISRQSVLDMHSLQRVAGRSGPTVRQMELCEHGRASQAKAGHRAARDDLKE